MSQSSSASIFWTALIWVSVDQYANVASVSHRGRHKKLARAALTAFLIRLAAFFHYRRGSSPIAGLAARIFVFIIAPMKKFLPLLFVMTVLFSLPAFASSHHHHHSHHHHTSHHHSQHAS